MNKKTIPPLHVEAVCQPFMRLTKFAGERTMIWQLNPVPEGTNVVIAAENVPDGILRADHEAGFAATLHNLAAFAEHRS